ncbi:hypothetical protein QWI30_03220 [Citrobacter freundii]|nr:hypothetical protein [Citrobacter freundii]
MLAASTPYPDNLTVGNWLDTGGTSITTAGQSDRGRLARPERHQRTRTAGQSDRGRLRFYLSGTSITAAGQSDRGRLGLYLSGTSITALPGQSDRDARST